MVSYNREEIISASEMARGFSNVLKEIMNHTKERFAISKNNKIEAVVLQVDEYERLKEAYELIEHLDIYRKLQERKASKTIPLETSAEKYGIDLDAL